MTDSGGALIGRRVEHYRRLNGMTREELADATSGQVGRDVIANIENGRRKDVTVSQLLSLSSALEVPPTALIFDLSSPLQPLSGGPKVTLSERQGIASAGGALTVAGALKWWSFDSRFRFEGNRKATEQVAVQVSAWERYFRISNLLGSAHSRFTDSKKLGGKPKREQYELAEALMEAWAAYRTAVAVGIVGLAEPNVPESLLDELLEGAAEQFDRSIDG